MSEAAVARRKRFERAYWRLDRRGQKQFDLECAERVLALFEARRPDDTRVRYLLERVRANPGDAEVQRLRDELYDAIEAERLDDDFEVRIALNAARSAYAAAAPIYPYTFSSDQSPASAEQANDAVYLDAYVRTRDLDLAEAARSVEIERQLVRLDELAATKR